MKILSNRKSLLRFVARMSSFGALLGGLLTVIITLAQDMWYMSLATTWDLFVHLAPWEWASPKLWAATILGGAVIVPILAIVTLYLSERPRWSE